MCGIRCMWSQNSSSPLIAFRIIMTESKSRFQREKVYDLLSSPNPEGLTRKQIEVSTGIKKGVLGFIIRKMVEDGSAWIIRVARDPLTGRMSMFYTSNKQYSPASSKELEAMEKHEKSICKVCGKVLDNNDDHRRGYVCNDCRREIAKEESKDRIRHRNYSFFPDLPGEEWKEVRDGCGLKVSNLGRIRMIDGRIFKPAKHRQGYLWIRVRGKQRLVHRIVAEAFILNPNNKPVVNHKNNIKNDNRVDNLEWTTQSENCLHAFRTKARVVTDKQLARVRQGYKLHEEQVREIRERYKLGEKISLIAYVFGVSRGHVCRIVHNKSRASIK